MKAKRVHGFLLAKKMSGFQTLSLPVSQEIILNYSIMFHHK
jgi:hypothetical protein